MSSRILIVDDNPTNLRLAASVLRLEGHQVDQAGDADQALAWLAEHVPDLILMDIALPGMDGLTLTRRIKSEPRLQQVPVVALTAFAMKGDEEKARAAGCIGYLTKPIDTREFGRQVASFLLRPPDLQTLLIVDDHPVNLRLLRAQLETEGITAIAAENGVEALEQLDRTPVDGVISDILMPRMDGYRLCLEVRKRPQFATLPFVLYTSTYNSPADRALADAAGADAYISKPSPIGDLLAALRRARGRPRQLPLPSEELESPVLKQYSETLIRKLEEKSDQLSRAFEGLAQTEARLSGLVESALDAIVAVDERQRIVLFNGAAERMFGVARSQAVQQSIDQFIPERYRGAHRGQLRAFGAGQSSGRTMGARMVWAQRADGTEFPVEASISRLATSCGMLFTVFLRDISERYAAEQALANSELRLRRVNRVLSVLSGINNLIVRTTNRDDLLRGACRIAVESGQFTKVWVGLVDGRDKRLRLDASHGCDAAFLAEVEVFLQQQDAAQHAPWAHALRSLQPVVLNQLGDEPAALQTALATGSRSLAALPLARDGDVAGVMVLHAAEPSFFDDEGMALLRELAGDISFALANLGRLEQLHFLANFDPLTGLPNRAQFSEQLGYQMAGIDRHGGLLAVVLLDLERFRHVNETLGRLAGDELLRQVGARLRAVNASASHFGGDSFALRLDEEHSAADVARALEEIAAECFGTPFRLHDVDLRVGIRMGISVHPGDGDDVESLLRNAEAAVRRARQSVEQRVFYAPELNARAAESLGLESRLRRAIERKEFLLHYQPKVDMVSRRLVGLEALIRWQDPERGLVAPGQFVPMLEECGLIGVVGEWALDDALDQQRDWIGKGLQGQRMAVNVSPMQLRPAGFTDAIGTLIARHPGADLELEITETVIMDDVERNIAAITRLRSLGVGVAIDDFGTGYCSLAYIAKLPVNSLKIDRSFVLGMTESPEGLAIVSSIIALAHSLGLEVVAEGVETEEQAQLLRLLACDQAQGYLFSRPLPADQIADLLRRDEPLP